MNILNAKSSRSGKDPALLSVPIALLLVILSLLVVAVISAFGGGVYLIASIVVLLILVALIQRNAGAFLMVLTYPLQNLILVEIFGLNLKLFHLAVGFTWLNLLLRPHFTIDGLIKLLRGYLPVLIAVMGFIFTIIISMAWTPDFNHGLLKSVKFVTNLLVFLSISILLSVDFKKYLSQIALGFILSTLWIWGSTMVDLASSGILEGILRGQFGPAAFIAGGQVTNIIGNALGSSFEGASGRQHIAGLWLITGSFVITAYWMVEYRPGMANRQINLLRLLWAINLGWLAISLSRSNAFVLFLSGMTFLLVSGRLSISRITKSLSLVALIIVGVIVSPLRNLILVVIFRFRGLFDDPVSVGGRLALWERALELFYSKPLMGVGIGAARLEAAEVFENIGLPPVDNFHNIYLQFLAEIGLTGILTVIGLTLGSIWISILNIVKSADSITRDVSAISLALLLMYYARTIVGLQFDDAILWIILGFSAGVTVWIGNLEITKPRHLMLS